MSDLRHQAANAIREHLQRDVGYAADLVAVLKESELCDIVDNDRPNGAVAIAAVIYQARLRMAMDEANEHAEVIERTVPVVWNRQTEVGVDGPGIKEVVRDQRSEISEPDP